MFAPASHHTSPRIQPLIKDADNAVAEASHEDLPRDLIGRQARDA